MGVTEEAGKTLSGFVDAMKTQPLALALVLMNIVLLGLLWSNYTTSSASNTKYVEMIFNAQREMQILLSKCVVPDKATLTFGPFPDLNAPHRE